MAGAGGVSRWENAEPADAIDAQIKVLRDARAAALAEVQDTEQRAVQTMTDGLLTDGTADRLNDLRDMCHDFTSEIDDLQTERRLLPSQRRPTS